jgi:hypothetical protein
MKKVYIEMVADETQQETFKRVWRLDDETLSDVVLQVREKQQAVRDIKTDQELFHYIKNHLLTQGRKSFAADEYSCLYFSLGTETKEVYSCAVGCVMNINIYMNYLVGVEGNSVENITDIMEESLPAIEFGPSTVELLSAMQSVHDQLLVKYWEGALQDTKWHFDEEGRFIRSSRLEDTEEGEG